MSELPISSEKKTPEVFEINIADILLFVKKFSIRIITTAIIFGIIGYGASYLVPVAYKSKSLLLPESGSGNSGMGSLSGLARLSGLSKSDNGGALQPELYPSVLQTIPFALYILRQPVTNQNGHNYKSMEEFLLEQSSNSSEDSFTKYKGSKPLSKDIVLLSPLEEIYTKSILSSITTFYDLKTGVISIEAEMPDPIVAAQTVEASNSYLIKYVSDYRTEKSIQEVKFLGQRAVEAKKREQSAELALQSYRDRNRSAFLNVARIEEQRLQSEYTLAQSLYSDIVRKWEEAKIKVKEQQPVIKVLEPTKIVFNKSKPRRLIFAIIFTLLGVFSSLIFFLFKEQN